MHVQGACLIMVTVVAAAAAVAAEVGAAEMGEAVVGTSQGGQSGQQPFSLKEVLDGTFSPSGIGSTQWITRGVQEFLIYKDLGSGDLVELDLANNQTTTLVPDPVLEQDGHSVGRGSWQFSPDATYLLWSYEAQAVFRHSTIAKYAVLQVNDSTWSELHDSKLLHYATWAPTGHALAYVHENDIYYVPDVADVSKWTRITEDGEEGVVYNGVPDWVYEEEVLGSASAMWFSPDGGYLAYVKFNDTEVENFKYINYGWTQFTEVKELRYPKPGTTNPTVSLFVRDLCDVEAKPDFIPPPGNDEILQNVGWVQDVLVAVWMSRIQNTYNMLFYAGMPGNWRIIYSKPDFEENGWIEVGALVAAYAPGGEGSEGQDCEREAGDAASLGVATLLAHAVPWASASHGRLLHPAVVGVAGNVGVQPVNDTSVATAVYAWNADDGFIYYQAAPADLPAQRHVFAVKTTDDADPVCLTCSMTQPDGEQCLYASAAFSPRTQYAVVTCSGPGPALVVAVKVEADTFLLGSPVRVMQNNSALRKKLETRTWPHVITNITVPLADGFTAQVRLWLPPDLDENEKCPMIVYVYGGPGSQQVSEAYSVGWGHYLSTSRRVVYAAIDGRGSGGQGNRRLFALYRQLGTVEVEDQIAVARALAEMLPYVDGERVGIWGWSYGGYATAMAMARDTGRVFACGAAVAPVTDWMLYDSVYAERYMRLPQDNKYGYENGNVSNKLGNFESHRLLLLHGNADDNVHYQQTMRLVRELELKDVLFEQESYPDENHGIRSVLQHVHHTMTDFFERCFTEVMTTTMTTISSETPPATSSSTTSSETSSSMSSSMTSPTTASTVAPGEGAPLLPASVSLLLLLVLLLLKV